MSTSSNSAVVLPSVERERVFTGLVTQVNRGNDQAATQLLALCQRHPELWERLASLERMAIDSWLRLLAPGTAPQPIFNRSSILAELERQRSDLQEAGDPPLERLLVGRILSAWLQVLYTETKYAQVLAAKTSTGSARDHWQKTADRAQRQLLRAIQALATTRRLLRPTTVNIAQNQINVAG